MMYVFLLMMIRVVMIEFELFWDVVTNLITKMENKKNSIV